jgi:hypothetical protein
MGYNVLCFDHRSVVSARVLYDDNPTVDLTQIQIAPWNNQSTTVVYKPEKVVSSFQTEYITNVCPVYHTDSCRLLTTGSGFSATANHVGFILDNLVLEKLFSRTSFFPCPLSLHHAPYSLMSTRAN